MGTKHSSPSATFYSNDFYSTINCRSSSTHSTRHDQSSQASEAGKQRDPLPGKGGRMGRHRYSPNGNTTRASTSMEEGGRYSEETQTEYLTTRSKCQRCASYTVSYAARCSVHWGTTRRAIHSIDCRDRQIQTCRVVPRVSQLRQRGTKEHVRSSSST